MKNGKVEHGIVRENASGRENVREKQTEKPESEKEGKSVFLIRCLQTKTKRRKLYGVV